MKTVKIIVQGPTENAEEFGQRLTEICKEIQLPELQFTSASDGRQTCNIVYYTPYPKQS